MDGFLVEFYLKGTKVYERICKSSTKLNAISTALRNYESTSDFDNIKAHKVKLSYEVVSE